MTANTQTASERLEAIVEEFADLDPRERLELLLEFAENLPPLPEHYEAQRQSGMNRVHECQTPVYLWVESSDGVLQLYAWVAPEAPTVKGFVAILVSAFSGVRPAELHDVPPNLLHRMGLVEALGMVRMRGLSAILGRIRNEVARRAHT